MWSRGELAAFMPAPSHHLFSGPKNTVAGGTTAENRDHSTSTSSGTGSPNHPWTTWAQGTLARALEPRQITTS
ncbi:hypothetical protein JOD62_001600 [Microbacterium keratanolyticum]|uniref:Uncharacterized protein n=1 Tax=Microbacterium keratanolyticum TaxID=67574 RepID=A0A9W6M8D4_9MICO|nr:hypothetical protein [Microbacterium keratanolyticum]GLK01131.1 hypothetical protein GCM10017596_08460 [Microbacterium keratanolyticum]